MVADGTFDCIIYMTFYYLMNEYVPFEIIFFNAIHVMWGEIFFFPVNVKKC